MRTSVYFREGQQLHYQRDPVPQTVRCDHSGLERPVEDLRPQTEFRGANKNLLSVRIVT